MLLKNCSALVAVFFVSESDPLMRGSLQLHNSGNRLSGLLVLNGTGHALEGGPVPGGLIDIAVERVADELLVGEPGRAIRLVSPRLPEITDLRVRAARGATVVGALLAAGPVPHRTRTGLAQSLDIATVLELNGAREVAIEYSAGGRLNLYDHQALLCAWGEPYDSRSAAATSARAYEEPVAKLGIYGATGTAVQQLMPVPMLYPADLTRRVTIAVRPDLGTVLLNDGAIHAPTRVVALCTGTMTFVFRNAEDAQRVRVSQKRLK